MACLDACVKCANPYVDGPGGTVTCKNGVLLSIPDDPAQMVAAQYRQHASTAWRDSAVALPYFNGAYTHTLESKKQMFKPRVYRDACLLFTANGDVFDFEAIHNGYDQEGFQRRVDGIMTDFTPAILGQCRGLYRVDGSKLTCSLTAVADEQYGYSGTLGTDLNMLKLKRTNARGHKVMKAEYTFRPISVRTPADEASPPPSLPVAVIRAEPAVAAKAEVAVDGAVDVGRDVFDVILEVAGNKKIQVIKAVRDVAPLGLREAKDLVDSTPALVLRRVDQETAAKAKVLLEQVGAKVTLRSE